MSIEEFYRLSKNDQLNYYNNLSPAQKNEFAKASIEYDIKNNNFSKEEEDMAKVFGYKSAKEMYLDD